MYLKKRVHIEQTLGSDAKKSRLSFIGSFRVLGLLYISLLQTYPLFIIKYMYYIHSCNFILQIIILFPQLMKFFSDIQYIWCWWQHDKNFTLLLRRVLLSNIILAFHSYCCCFIDSLELSQLFTEQLGRSPAILTFWWYY